MRKNRERSAASGSGIWMGVRANFCENVAVTDASFLSGVNRTFSGYSSGHPGGVQFALCDGSVRFVADHIESLPTGTGLFQLLAARNDGQTVDF